MKCLLTLLLTGAVVLASQAQDSLDYASQIARYREARKVEFIENPRAPLHSEEELNGLRYFPPDERYRVVATFQRTPNEKPFLMATSAGIAREYVKYGVAYFELDGQRLRLALYKDLRFRNVPAYAGLLFVPFRDLTNGEETYGGGRYIDLEEADIQDGKIIIDFNKAYNPWCHYADGYACPIPPVENHLPVAIRAGEKIYEGASHH